MHNRKFVPSDVSLVQGRIRNLDKTIFIHDAIENLIIKSGMLEDAPFRWVGLTYRLGRKNMLKPEYDKIDKKDGELPIAVEMKMDILQSADSNDIELLKDLYMIAGIEALIDVCKKYKLQGVEFFEAERSKYRPFPESVEELESTK